MELGRRKPEEPPTGSDLARPSGCDIMKDEVVKVLNEQVRPGLQRDGGGIELVNVDEEKGEVQVKLTGACGGCPMATMTMVGFVEATIKKEVPGVNRVVPV